MSLLTIQVIKKNGGQDSQLDGGSVFLCKVVLRALTVANKYFMLEVGWLSLDLPSSREPWSQARMHAHETAGVRGEAMDCVIVVDSFVLFSPTCAGDLVAVVDARCRRLYRRCRRSDRSAVSHGNSYDTMHGSA